MLAKSKQANKTSTNSLNALQQQEVKDNGLSLEETVKRIKKDQRKFAFFWEGVKAGVDAHELKQKHERQQVKLEHHRRKTEVS